jgi:hypothetical protein
MKPSVLDGEYAGVRKAGVERWNTCGSLGFTWLAHHDCGWMEELDEWHNAFWAADHHMRYDCGRREQPSSGKYAVPDGYESDPCPSAYEEDVHAPHIYKDPFTEQKTWCPGPAQLDITVHKQTWYQTMSDEEYRDKLAGARAMHLFLDQAGEAMDRWLIEGGVQNDPTPPVEGPTVELGAITTELGPVPGEEWDGFQLEGWSEGGSGGSGGWWERVRRGRQR